MLLRTHPKWVLWCHWHKLKMDDNLPFLPIQRKKLLKPKNRWWSIRTQMCFFVTGMQSNVTQQQECTGGKTHKRHQGHSVISCAKPLLRVIYPTQVWLPNTVNANASLMHKKQLCGQTYISKMVNLNPDSRRAIFVSDLLSHYNECPHTKFNSIQINTLSL